MLLQALGYLASLLVAVSLTMRSIVRLRVVNLAGALCFAAYGLALEAYPVLVVNLAIVGINLYYLREMAGAGEYFHLLEVPPTSEYLREFLRFHEHDIPRVAPGFDPRAAEGQVSFFVLRDLVPAGLFIAAPHAEERDALWIKLDYVSPRYRDFKVAAFVFQRHAATFLERGVETLWSAPGDARHEAYLRRMGFVAQRAGDGATAYRLDLRAAKP